MPGRATTEAARRRARPPRHWSRDTVETAVFKVLRWLVIAGFVVVCLFPFYYMVLLSLRSIQQLLLEPSRLLPSRRELTLSTYTSVLKSVDAGGQGFLTLMKNSGIISILTVLVTLLVSIPGSYAVSRLRFAGRRQVHFLFLAVYLFPSIVLAIPLFVLFTRIGLRGSLVGLVIVYISQTVPVAVYMLRNYFETIPRSLEEAAAVDGCSRLRILWSVSLPLAKPAIMATSLYVFMIAWNEYLFALLFLVENRERWTVSLGLAQLSGSIEIPTTVLMAGSVILTLPILILFFLSERLLTEGLTAGADKG
ncbi:carbohydrate ABC transporter permease [Jatrophihabitans sp.]|uniref:carbohydrate ABC transporter permease n=1 Tax=Jatrophihabitans sp. TaxID=1932789 RepID=UPI0038CD4C00